MLEIEHQSLENAPAELFVSCFFTAGNFSFLLNPMQNHLFSHCIGFTKQRVNQISESVGFL